MAFADADRGLAAALAAQWALQSEPWDPAALRVRMGLHTGEAEASRRGRQPALPGLPDADRAPNG